MSRTQILLIGALLIVLVLYTQQPQALNGAAASLGIDLNGAYGNAYNGDTQSYGQSNAYDLTGYGGGYDLSGSEQGVSLQDQPGSNADILARTIYGEARGGGAALMQGVASVVMNRARVGGASVSAVCLKPSAFSCWNANDPNLPVIQAVTTSNSIFQQCLQLANEAIAGSLPDNTGGALNYYATTIAAPYWAASMRETVQIGNTIFFAPAGTA